MGTIKKKIIFIIPGMHGGGAERVFSLLVRHINRDKYIPVLALIKKEGKFLKDIPSDVEIIDLNSNRARYAWCKIIKLLWNQKPDIVFSTLGQVNLMLASLKFLLPRKTKYIAREANIVSFNIPNEGSPMLFYIFYKTFLRKMDLIICQSQEMKLDLQKNFRVPIEKMKVINNPVDINEINIKRVEETERINEKNYFLAVGRLEPQKGYDRLIQAFSLSPLLNAHLYIIGKGGEGSLEEKLKKQVSDLNLNNRVIFLGFQDNPYKYMNSCKALIMTSHYEGFPNVAIEANACGVPVIAFDCPGVREAIVDGVNGWLVEQDNINSLAQKIEQVSAMEFDKNKILEYVINKYKVNLIVNKYEHVFEEIKQVTS